MLKKTSFTLTEHSMWKKKSKLNSRVCIRCIQNQPTFSFHVLLHPSQSYRVFQQEPPPHLSMAMPHQQSQEHSTCPGHVMSLHGCTLCALLSTTCHTDLCKSDCCSRWGCLHAATFTCFALTPSSCWAPLWSVMVFSLPFLKYLISLHWRPPLSNRTISQQLS